MSNSWKDDSMTNKEAHQHHAVTLLGNHKPTRVLSSPDGLQTLRVWDKPLVDGARKTLSLCLVNNQLPYLDKKHVVVFMTATYVKKNELNFDGALFNTKNVEYQKAAVKYFDQLIDEGGLIVNLTAYNKEEEKLLRRISELRNSK